MNKRIDQVTSLFPLWAIIISAIAYFTPSFFASWKSAIVPLLTLIMFGMGMTLKWEDFARTFKEPKRILLGIFLQYTIMPLTAYVISLVLGLSEELTIGMVLVGCSAGGTASNVITYLAGGDVALSITLTMCSTLLAVIATPTLSYVFLNQFIEIPFFNMLLTILQIIIAPVLIGTLLNSLFEKRMESVKSIFPLISVVAIVLIIGIVIGLNQSKLFNSGFILVIAVMLHNLSGLSFGYYLSKLFRFDEITCRTIAIEVGMQNSGLSVALAVKFFGALSAVPGAIFSVWHNLSGSLLAGIWGRVDNNSVEI